ncbi:class I SAM-dependent methyltransferase, partial [Pseudomonadota bacterium]
MNSEHSDFSGLAYDDSERTCPSYYLWDSVSKIIKEELSKGDRIFEIGCGNGATSGMLLELGYDVIGIDPSKSGIEIARVTHPGGRFEVGSAYDDLASQYGRFPLVISLEVVEHCYWPRKFARCIFDLLEPGGTAMISTPYHGYLKN